MYSLWVHCSFAVELQYVLVQLYTYSFFFCFSCTISACAVYIIIACTLKLTMKYYRQFTLSCRLKAHEKFPSCIQSVQCCITLRIILHMMQFTVTYLQISHAMIIFILFTHSQLDHVVIVSYTCFWSICRQIQHMRIVRKKEPRLPSTGVSCVLQWLSLLELLCWPLLQLLLATYTTIIKLTYLTELL